MMKSITQSTMISPAIQLPWQRQQQHHVTDADTVQYNHGIRMISKYYERLHTTVQIHVL